MTAASAAAVPILILRRYRHVLLGAGAFIGIAVAVAAQAGLAPARAETAEVGRLVFGVVLTALCLSTSVTARAPASHRPEQPVGGWRLVPLTSRVVAITAGIVLARATYEGAADNDLSTRDAAVWILSLVAFGGSLWTYGATDTRGSDGVSRPRQKRWLVPLGLLLLLMISGYFLFFRIDSIPREMTGDVIVNVVDIESKRHGAGRVYYPYSDGAVFVYAAAPVAEAIGGPTDFLTVKLTGAVAGLLTVLVVFLLVREAFQSDRLGLVAAGLLSSAHWAVLLTRSGYRLTFTPLLTALVFWLFLRALRTRARNDFVLCGAALGLSLYSYTPVRVLPLLLLGCLVLTAGREVVVLGRKSGPSLRRLGANSLCLFAVAAVVVVPLARYAIDHPEEYWRQFRMLGPSAEDKSFWESLEGILFNLKEVAFMFNWVGDAVWVSNIPYAPALDDLTAVLFPVGLLLLGIWAVIRRDLVPVFMLANLLAMILPSVGATANPGDNPSFGRASGAIPFVFAASSIAVGAAMQTLGTAAGMLGKYLAWLLFAVVLAWIALTNYSWYFQDYAPITRTHSLNQTEISGVIQDFVNGGGRLSQAFLVSYPHWMDVRGIAIELREPTWANSLLKIEDADKHRSLLGPKLYLLNQRDAKSAEWLMAAYPQGRIELFPSSVDRDHNFLVFLSQPLE